MEQKKDYSMLTMLIGAIAGFLIFVLSPCLLAGLVVWLNNAPSTLGVSFPEGTEIIEQFDTHQGLFRKKGVAVTIVQIPQEARPAFEERLLEENFWDGPIGYDVSNGLEGVENSTAILNAENILWTYQDEAIALVEEPFSDYFAAIYDLESGIYCCVEYDS